MRKTFTLSSAGFASLALLLSSLLGNGARAQASTLSDWQYNPEESALAFQIESGLKPTYFLLPNPLRIVVDLPNTNLQTTQTDRSFSGDVSRIRVSEFEPGVTRLVMELAPNSVLQRGQVSLEDLGNGQWKIRPLIEASGRSPLNCSHPPVPWSCP
ncbi:MAG: AMIN domain-containing protein [Synechococcales cyanobacterium CRU_2_2]|nr:AMIN domain-containing protein [Synechococcales cyanobacterium CRU_2_2]